MADRNIPTEVVAKLLAAGAAQGERQAQDVAVELWSVTNMAVAMLIADLHRAGAIDAEQLHPNLRGRHAAPGDHRRRCRGRRGAGALIVSRPVKLTPAGVFWIGYLLVLLVGGLLSVRAAAADIPQGALKHRADLTRNARAVWGLDAPVATFAGQVHQESRWRPEAVSPVGAQGIAQFMPATADWIAEAYPALADQQPFNPGWGLRALVTYDRHLWERIAKGAQPDELLGMLTELYPEMDAAGLQERLARMIFVANLWGRLHA